MKSLDAGIGDRNVGKRTTYTNLAEDSGKGLNTGSPTNLARQPEWMTISHRVLIWDPGISSSD